MQVHSKTPKENEFTDNKLCYYLKPTNLPTPRFCGLPKILNPDVPVCPIVSYSDSPSCSLNKYVTNILRTYIKEFAKNSS